MITDTAAPKLRLQGVTKTFTAPRTGQQTLAVAEVNLDIQTGEFVCIVGPSGCGKSTVLNMIAGLDKPSTGRLDTQGRCGLMFQEAALFRKAMVLLASHAYRIPQYRFVIDLFDKSVLRKIVLEDEESSGSEESEE